MAVKFISIKCPECGANLPIEEGRKTMFCSYCGRQVMMVNENEYKYEVTHHYIDDAKIMRAETNRAEKEAEQAYKLRELEIENQKDRRRQIGWWIVYGIIFVLIVVSIFDMIGKDEPTLLGILGLMVAVLIAILAFSTKLFENDKIRDEKAIRSGKIRLTDKALDYEGENYLEMRNIFYDLGFTNVTLKNAQDLKFGIFNKAGSVYDITINRALLSNSKWYEPNSKVVIKYHDFPE